MFKTFGAEIGVHERRMRLALEEAKIAFEKGEVPVGAVVVWKNQIIGRGHNEIETLQDPTAHAEILAITAAANTLSSWRLEGASLYVTLEPCPMCAGAIIHSRIGKLFFGPADPKWGACGSLYNIVQDERLNHKVEVISGVLEKESSDLLKEFFKFLRRKN
ncbi:tRNA-specific adenosine deaminase [bacterium BMS3Abin05]|nr:tRNA-specific adenosine deaminase [bacterium BMS3Abin05]GBE28520.1 tRNA-specific adenosine deaminase [bacterium BMS3Bbin03]